MRRGGPERLWCGSQSPCPDPCRYGAPNVRGATSNRIPPSLVVAVAVKAHSSRVSSIVSVLKRVSCTQADASIRVSQANCQAASIMAATAQPGQSNTASPWKLGGPHSPAWHMSSREGNPAAAQPMCSTRVSTLLNQLHVQPPKAWDMARCRAQLVRSKAGATTCRTRTNA